MDEYKEPSEGGQQQCYVVQFVHVQKSTAAFWIGEPMAHMI